MRRTNARCHGWLALILISTGAITPDSAPALSERTLPHPVGVVEHQLWDESQEVGSHWARVPVQWKYVERLNDQYSWGATDNWLAQADARSMNITPVIVIGKVWANWQPGDPWNPTDPPEIIPEFDGSADGASRAPNDLLTTYNPAFGYSQTYYDFVFNWVSRYGDAIERITIENEVNAANFWESPIDDYLRILTTARLAATDANPDVLVFESGMGSGSWAAAIAQDRYENAVWTWQEARDYLRDYYARDVFVQEAFGSTLASMNSEGALQSFFNNAAVVANNDRVYTVLDNLYSVDLGMVLVDALNIKFTGEPWMIDDVAAWVRGRMLVALPARVSAGLVVPMVNNEASNWCVELGDYNSSTRRCDLSPSDEPILATELIRKVVRGIHAGVAQSVWFPLTNANVVSTPRIGLYDYADDRLETADAFAQISRFAGWSRDYTRLDRVGSVDEYVFTERVTGREDVRVLWWDDGNHGSGSSSVTIDVPTATSRAVHYTQSGDSTMLVIARNADTLGQTVDVTATEQPSFVYFDDGVTPLYELEPIIAPVPPAVTMAAPSPNPSSGFVRIRFGVPDEVSGARVDVFDVAGRHVVTLYDGRLTGGVFRVVWDGRDAVGEEIGAGTYVVRLTTETTGAHTRKVVIVR